MKSVIHEYTRFRGADDRLGLADRMDFKHFEGSNTLHGKGNFEFLHRHR